MEDKNDEYNKRLQWIVQRADYLSEKKMCENWKVIKILIKFVLSWLWFCCNSTYNLIELWQINIAYSYLHTSTFYINLNLKLTGIIYKI